MALKDSGSKITARLSSEISVLLSRSHVLRLFPKKKKIDGLVVQLNEDTVQAKSSMLVVRSVIGYIVSYGIEVTNVN